MARIVTANDVLDGHVVLDIACLDRGLPQRLRAHIAVQRAGGRVHDPASGHADSLAGRAVEPGSQAVRPGLDPAWLAGRTSCPQQRRPDASGDSTPGRHGDQVMERVAPRYAELGVVSTAFLLLVSPGPARGRVPVRGAIRVRGRLVAAAGAHGQRRQHGKQPLHTG